MNTNERNDFVGYKVRDDIKLDAGLKMAAQCHATDEAGFSSAAFDFTVHRAIPDSGQSNALLIRSCSTPGAAACDAEERKLSAFLRREKEVALLLLTDKGVTWERGFQFRPFGMDIYGAYGPEARKSVDQLSEIRASRVDLINRPRHAAARSSKP